MEEILKTLASSGIPGAILAFALWKIAPVVTGFRDEICASLRKVEEAIDRANRGDILRLCASMHVSDQVKEVAAQILKELDAAEVERKNRAEQAAAK